MSASGFLRKHWLEFSLGLGVPVVLLLISPVIASTLYRDPAVLYWEIRGTAQLVSVSDVVNERVTVSFDGNAVPNLYVLNLRLRNASRRDIVGQSDVASPVGLTFHDWTAAARLLGEPIVRSNLGNSALAFYQGDSPDELMVSFDILRSGSYVDLDLLYSAAAPLTVDAIGKVRDISIVVRSTAAENEEYAVKRLALARTIGFLATGLLGFASPMLLYVGVWFMQRRCGKLATRNLALLRIFVAYFPLGAAYIVAGLLRLALYFPLSLSLAFYLACGVASTLALMLFLASWWWRWVRTL